MSTNASALPPRFSTKRYNRLLADQPVQPIRTDQQNEEYIERLETLYGKGKLTPEEAEYGDLLLMLISAFEKKYDRLPATPLMVLRHLMDQNGLKRSDLADVFGKSTGLLSEIMQGKRGLSKTHIERLSHKFQVSPAVFF